MRLPQIPIQGGLFITIKQTETETNSMKIHYFEYKM